MECDRYQEIQSQEEPQFQNIQNPNEQIYVENPKKVQELINELVKASNRLSSSISTLDIRGLALNTKYRIKNIEEKQKEEDDNGEVRNSLKKKI